MLGPVTCAACGAKVREDRLRCLRCGTPLAVAKAADSAPIRRRWLVAGAAAVCVALGGFAVVIAGRLPSDGVDATRPVMASGRAAVVPAVADTTTRAAAAAVSPAAAMLDRAREGTAAYAGGDVAGAIDRFQAAVDADPDNAMALNNLAQVLVRAGRTREALPYFDRAIELSPATWAYRFNRGRAYGLLETWPGAIADYREAARLFPDDYVTPFNLALALQANGDLPGAIESYRHAITLAPGQADFYLPLAHALELARQPADAVTAYRQYLELEPGSPQADKIKGRIAQLAP